jgi:amino acid permease
MINFLFTLINIFIFLYIMIWLHVWLKKTSNLEDFIKKPYKIIIFILLYIGLRIIMG